MQANKTFRRNCRRNLQDNFNETTSNSFLQDSRKVLRNSAECLQKTYNHIKTSLGTFTQKFKIATKRRQILEEGPMTPNGGLTPHTYSKRVLGRTPERMYSPFGIETPYNPTTVRKLR